MEKTVITWSVENCVSIFLMALLGFVLFGLFANIFTNMSKTDENS
jgi:hypothetical protein